MQLRVLSEGQLQGQPSSAASKESILQKRKGYIKLFRRSPFWQEEAISNKDDGSEGCTLWNIPSLAFRKGGNDVERIQDSNR